jgi:hypothetical protein
MGEVAVRLLLGLTTPIHEREEDPAMSMERPVVGP